MDPHVDTDVISQLIRLQDIDRFRDRLTRRLEEVPVKLRSHTDRIAALERELEEQETLRLHLKSEADRAELEVQGLEEQREKTKHAMNAPKLSAREYEVLQEQLAGLLADINSQSDKALKAMDQASEAESAAAAVRAELDKAKAAYKEAKDKLEGSLSGVRQDLDKRNAERAEYAQSVTAKALEIYQRVRSKHNDAMSMMDGTIDRAAGRIGTDLHCSACYMTVTANDALRVLARKEIVQCKSCVRILYVP